MKRGTSPKGGKGGAEKKPQVIARAVVSPRKDQGDNSSPKETRGKGKLLAQLRKRTLKKRKSPQGALRKKIHGKGRLPGRRG